MQSVVKSVLLGLFVTIAVMVTVVLAMKILRQSREFDYVQKIELLQERLNGLTEERESELRYSNRLKNSVEELIKECFGLTEELQKAKKVNVVLAIGNERLQDELRQAVDYCESLTAEEPVGMLLDIRCSGRWDGECDYHAGISIPIINGAVRIPAGQCPECTHVLQYYMAGTPDPMLESLEESSELDEVKAELEMVQNALAETIVAQESLTLPELVEEVIGGVVHIKIGVDGWGGQASGFVIGPRLIKTARHITKGRVNFTLTTNGGHVIKATRAISHKGHDTGFIYIDDLICVAENCGEKHKVELHVLELGSIKDCKLGQEVFSIGSTYGMVNFNAVAKGIIQTLDNKLVEYSSQVGPEYGWSTLFSMTQEGGGGNSGCPLFTMDGKVVGVWVGSAQPNVHYAIPVDVFVDDIDAVMLMFVQDKYRVERVPDNRISEMKWQISGIQQQISYLQQDSVALLDMYEWFLENKEDLLDMNEWIQENKEVLDGVESLRQAVEDLKLMVGNIMQSVTLREYLNL